jgi:hypothetical protein
VVRAFVPTGSKSGNCLATLNETRTNVFPAGLSPFCRERAPSAFVGVPWRASVSILHETGSFGSVHKLPLFLIAAKFES